MSLLTEKETQKLFDAADGEFEELDDDFILAMNDGQPLLIGGEEE